MHVILVSETTTIFVAFIPSNVTVVLPSKFVPVIVTGVPKWPLVGLTVVIVGFAYVKPFVNVVVPIEFVTTTFTAPFA